MVVLLVHEVFVAMLAPVLLLDHSGDATGGELGEVREQLLDGVDGVYDFAEQDRALGCSQVFGATPFTTRYSFITLQIASWSWIVSENMTNR
jgi:hypothetical protein